ncbi:MAG: hypothetical protein ACKVP4_01000 [Hyphomicrobium sp.]
MTDTKNLTIIPPRATLPTRGTAPAASLPSLPSSSGKIWGSATTIMRADAAYVQHHTEFLQARVAQSSAMKDLVESRVALATVIAKLQTIDEIIAHEYRRGHADRQSEVAEWAHTARLATLRHERDELDAVATLIRSRQRLAELDPKPPQPPPLPEQSPVPPPPAAGLTPADVERVAQNMPELQPDSIRTLLLALNGLLAEKKA